MTPMTPPWEQDERGRACPACGLFAANLVADSVGLVAIRCCDFQPHPCEAKLGRPARSPLYITMV